LGQEIAVLRRLIATAALVAAFGCNTPSVPIPPPAVNALRFGDAPSAGQVVLTGQASSMHANARFFVFDHATGDGVITTAAPDGSFATPPFAASDGDVIQIGYTTPTGERSQEVCVGLQKNSALLSQRCP
jgi:hypothetical protein